MKPRRVLHIATLLTLATAATMVQAAPVPRPVAAPQIIRQQFVELIAVVAQEPLLQGGTVRGAVEVKIAPGYHVNANPPSENWLIPTEVTIKGADGVAVQEAFYPEAVERTFQFWPAPLRVYEGNVVVGFVVSVGSDTPVGPHDLQIVVRYQACNDEACFAPVDASYTVPVTIAPAGTPVRPAPSPLLERASFGNANRSHQR